MKLNELRAELAKQQRIVADLMDTINAAALLVQQQQDEQEPELLQLPLNWNIVDTGGGCKAWRLNLDLCFLLATDSQGCHEPQGASDALLVGFYVDTPNETEFLTQWEFESHADLLRAENGPVFERIYEYLGALSTIVALTDEPEQRKKICDAAGWQVQVWING